METIVNRRTFRKYYHKVLEIIFKDNFQNNDFATWLVDYVLGEENACLSAKIMLELIKKSKVDKRLLEQVIQGMKKDAQIIQDNELKELYGKQARNIGQNRTL